MTICAPRHTLSAPDPDSPCCWSSAEDPRDCTCWVPVRVDVDQLDTLDVQRLVDALRAGHRDVDDLHEGPPALRTKLCSDCAYRPGSPERRAQGGAQLDHDVLQRFYCHDGMLCIVAWWHPTAKVLRRVDDPRVDYDPPIRGDRAWRADGRPALLCAGWAAANRLRRGADR